jgi:hypothetical protein
VNHGPCTARVPGISNPMVGSLRGVCARATSGHATPAC